MAVRSGNTRAERSRKAVGVSSLKVKAAMTFLRSGEELGVWGAVPTPDLVPVMHPGVWARRPGLRRRGGSPDLEWVLQQRSDVTVLPSASERGAGRSVVGCRFSVGARPDPHRD